MLPIAANMPFPAFMLLVAMLIAYAVLALMATRARANEDRATADRFSGIGFALLLAAAAYAVILLIATAFSYWPRVYDMLIIMFMIGVFFALLLFGFFLLAEVLPRAIRRGRKN
jgi:hypothetical protein